MSAIIGTNRGGTCAICLDEFEAGEPQFTHVGGENHDGFHGTCLATWLTSHNTCPIDRQQIDPSSLVSRTERIMARIRPALRNGASAAFFGIQAAAAGAVMAIVAGVAGRALLDIATGGEVAEAIPKAVAEIMKSAGQVATGGAAAGAMGAAAAFSGLMSAPIASAIALIGLGAVGVPDAGPTGWTARSLLGILAAIGGAGAAGGAAVGSRLQRIFNERQVDFDDQKRIMQGLWVGGIAILLASVHLGIAFTPLTAIATTALLAGAWAGVIS